MGCWDSDLILTSPMSTGDREKYRIFYDCRCTYMSKIIAKSTINMVNYGELWLSNGLALQVMDSCLQNNWRESEGPLVPFLLSFCGAKDRCSTACCFRFLTVNPSKSIELLFGYKCFFRITMCTDAELATWAKSVAVCQDSCRYIQIAYILYIHCIYHHTNCS